MADENTPEPEEENTAVETENDADDNATDDEQ